MREKAYKTIEITKPTPKVDGVNRGHHFSVGRKWEEYCFEWDDLEKKTFIVVSLHGALALKEQFKQFGYRDITSIKDVEEAS